MWQRTCARTNWKQETIWAAVRRTLMTWRQPTAHYHEIKITKLHQYSWTRSGTMIRSGFTWKFTMKYMYISCNLQDFPLNVAIWSQVASDCFWASPWRPDDHEEFERMVTNKSFPRTQDLIQSVQRQENIDRSLNPKNNKNRKIQKNKNFKKRTKIEKNGKHQKRKRGLQWHTRNVSREEESGRQTPWEKLGTREDG